MNSNKVQFIFENKLIELKNPDPNQTILNFIRDKLKKKQEPKRDAPKVDVVLAQ